MAKNSDSPAEAQFNPDAQAAEAGSPASGQVLERPLVQILADLSSGNRRTKAQALERLAICLCRLIGLEAKHWLLRSRASSYGEVTLLADDQRLLYDRWLLQCHNGRQADMETIATAIGRGISFKPGVVLSATSGRFTQRTRFYATRTMQLSNLRILLLDADDLKAIADEAAMLERILQREAEAARLAKQEQLGPMFA